MEFLLSSELQAFGQELRKVLSDSDSSAARGRHVRQIDAPPVAAPLERALWDRIAGLGSLGAGLPEEADGLGLGALATQLIVEELSRSLAPVPAIESAGYAAGALLPLPPTEQRKELLCAIGAGEKRLTCSIPNLFDAGSVTAQVAGGEHRLHGEIPFVSSRVHSDLVIVLADHGEAGLYLIDAASPSLRAAPQETFDLIRAYERVTLADTPATLIAAGPGASARAAIGHRIEVLQAAELYGCGARALELTVEHAKTRTQFGAPLGTFQAVQHGLADMLLRVEQAGTLARFAAWCIDNDPQQLPQAAAAAKGFASEWIPKSIEKAIQLHGGIGFTYEYELHHYLRRAVMAAGLGPKSDECYATLAETRIALAAK